MSNRSGSCIALFLLLVGFLGFTKADAGVTLTLHWDRETGTSIAVLTNSVGDVLADFPWDGPLPSAYGAGTDEIEQPTFILGQLRDLLLGSTDPEADDALAFVRELMGPYADTSVELLSPSLTTGIGYASNEITEWCGIAVDSRGMCVQDEESGIASTFCREFPCKGTEIGRLP